MNILINDFIKLLEDEKKLYEKLALILQQEKRAVIDSDLDALNENSKQKENLVLKIRIMGEQRLDMIGRLSGLLNYSPRELTLTKLAQLVDEPYSTRLNEYHSNYLSIIQGIQELNQSNKELFSHSVELIRGSINLLSNLLPSTPVYHRTGKVKSDGKRGAVISDQV